jgi:glutathione S-transferase
MRDARKLTLFHAVNSRSAGVMLLLEELGATYELQVINLKSGENRQAAYLGINPMGKVPAIRHGDALVTEQPAIFIYLADLFAEAGLAPAPDDPDRGPYLRWMVYYGSCFEPALVDRAMKRDPAPPGMNPYGDFDTVQKTVNAQLEKGPYMLGKRFTALDILWGMALTWTTGFGIMPMSPAIRAYLDRFAERPALARVRAKDAEIAAAQEKK